MFYKLPPLTFRLMVSVIWDNREQRGDMIVECTLFVDCRWLKRIIVA